MLYYRAIHTYRALLLTTFLGAPLYACDAGATTHKTNRTTRRESSSPYFKKKVSTDQDARNDSKHLHLAARTANSSRVRGLLKLPHILPNFTDASGNTALHEAVYGASKTAAHLLLLDPRTNPNLKNKKGLTPLHLAAKFGSRKMITTLANGGADPERRTTKTGHSAIQLLEKRGEYAWAEELAKQFYKQKIKNNDADCIICLDTYEEMIAVENCIGFTPCCYSFICMRDLLDWRKRNETCPQCEKIISLPSVRTFPPLHQEQE